MTTAEFHLGDAVVRTDVVSGLGNTRRLLEQIEKGEVAYDFVEVMALCGRRRPAHPRRRRACL